VLDKCATCGEPLRRVPGGNGPVWVNGQGYASCLAGAKPAPHALRCHAECEGDRCDFVHGHLGPHCSAHEDPEPGWETEVLTWWHDSRSDAGTHTVNTPPSKEHRTMTNIMPEPTSAPELPCGRRIAGLTCGFSAKAHGTDDHSYTPSTVTEFATPWQWGDR